MKVLFVTTEVDPLIKVGGLADVSIALPTDLLRQGIDVRIIIPGTADALEKLSSSRTVAIWQDQHTGVDIEVLEGRITDAALTVYMVTALGWFDRPGTPYGEGGIAWPDNAERFALFCRSVARISLGQANLCWRPDVVHCNDWHTALVPALLTGGQHQPKSVFTVHNLAYQGVFPAEYFPRLGLPDDRIAAKSLEFWGQLSFIKAGLEYSSYVTTVSPSYGREVMTAEGGVGLDSLIRKRGNSFKGILNGIDMTSWNPATDPVIAQRFDIDRLTDRARNKRVLARTTTLDPDRPLIGFVGRLSEQKGVELLLSILAMPIAQNAQWIVLGDGEPQYHQALQEMQTNSNVLSVHFGMDEVLARQIYAGVDMLVVPSRFEPCGLCQRYALRYGAVPVVHATGGLIDTVVDTNEVTLHDDTATGFTFGDYTAEALSSAIERGLSMLDSSTWPQLQHNGMSIDASWEQAARSYAAVYDDLCEQGIASIQQRCGT